MTTHDPAGGRGRTRALAGALLCMLLLAVAAVTLGLPSPAAAAEACPNEALREAQRSTLLPDCRAYELVSPPNKHGADVVPETLRTRAAADGSAISFVSLGGFSDVRGTGQATEYLSQRSTDPDPGGNGWATHAITPPQQPLSLVGAIQGFDSLWVGDFSADLSTGVFRAWSPLSDEDPNVGNVENLYLRTDLRTPGAGSYQLLTRCSACTVPFSPFDIFSLPVIAGASADSSHVIFQSRLKLTADASSGSSNLYEWVNGSLRLAGILPDSACGTPPCPAPASTAGASAQVASPRTISPDGSRITFTDADGGLGASSGGLYQRIDGVQTVQINTSEKTVPDPPQPAKYQTASVDGTRVFFTTAEQMTNDDNDLAIDLYMWDATAPAGHHLTRLSVDSNPADAHNGVSGVLGASDDGHYVYFVAADQLVAGKPVTGESGIYLWHDGAVPAVAYVGEMALLNVDGSANFVGLDFVAGGSHARVTQDGRHLVFVSHSGVGLLSAHGGVDVDQTGCANRRCQEYYVYSADTDSLVCASCKQDGSPPTTDANNWVLNPGTVATALHLNHSFSTDGRWLFFHTSEALVRGDSNGVSDVYAYDVQTNKISLISSGVDPSPSYFLDASTDGKNVFFVTRQEFVGWDTDANADIYDARINGGLPEPVSAPPPCTGDACQRAPAPAPSPGTLPTGGSTGPGNFSSSGATVLVKPLTRAQKLSRALERCRKKHRKVPRKKCESSARKSFGRGK